MEAVRRRRSIDGAALAVVLVASCCVLQSVATARSISSSAVGPFCSEPTIGVEEGAPPVKARLGINKTTVRPGGAVRVRVENFGATDLGYGLAYELARRERRSWVTLPPEPVFMPRLYVRAGTASECQSIGIPRHAIPGRYRIAKKVRPVGSGRAKEVVVRATFKVFRRPSSDLPVRAR